MTKQELITRHREDILAFAARYGISNVRLFGSVARKEDGPQSDIDLFVKMEPRHGAFELLDFIEHVQSLLGVKIHVLTDHPWLQPRLRASVLQDAREL